MWDVLRWIGYGLLALIVLVTGVIAAYRLRGPSPEQRDALALMQTDYRPKEGTNAFPLLWFMQYDVADGELDTRMAADIAAAGKQIAADGMSLSYEPSAAKLNEAAADVAGLCEIRSKDCLAKVAADPESMRDALALHPVVLSRKQSFERTGFYWNDFPPDFRASAVGYPGQAQRVWLSSFALQYADGDHEGSLTGVCRNLDTWRRLRGGTNSLLGSMFAISFTDSGIRLFAEMLAALPDGEQVPDTCNTALRPIDGTDMDRCGEVAGEFAWLTTSMRQSVAQARAVSWMDRAFGWATLDMRQSDAWRAETLAPYCGEEATSRMLADVPFPAEAIHPVARRVECVSNLAGCILTDIAAPAYVEYDSRTLDFAAHLRLAAALLWLRDRAVAGSLARLDNRPPQLRSGARKSGFDPQTRVLFVENLNRREPRFDLPVSQSAR